MRRVAAGVGLVLLAGSVGVQRVWATRIEDRPSLPAVRYLRSPEVARRLALSYDMLAADLYWIRALQTFGSTRLQQGGEKTYADLYPFLDLTTSLDPHFNVAYRFGAIFLSEPPPGGPGRADLAIALLEKGIAANPTRWEYYQDIGFVHYWWSQDYVEAASWFERGAALPAAPWWLKSMAATTLAAGGDLRNSRFMWRRLLETADNDWLRRDAARRLQQIDTLERIDRLSEGVGRARAAGLGPPWSWATLFAHGLVSAVPVDAEGVPLVIDLTSGHIDVAQQSPLWPLPAPPVASTATASGAGDTP